MSAFEDFIRYLEQYYPLSEDLKEYLKESVREQIYPRNHSLLHTGYTPKCIWFIANGTARVHRFDDTGNDLTLWYWRNEIIMPFDGLFHQLPSYNNISLCQRSNVLSLSYVHLKYLYQIFPEYHVIGQLLLENITNKLCRHLDLIQHEESAARYQFLLKHHAALLRHASLKDVASFLGMSLSTIKHLRYG